MNSFSMRVFNTRKESSAPLAHPWAAQVILSTEKKPREKQKYHYQKKPSSPPLSLLIEVGGEQGRPRPCS